MAPGVTRWIELTVLGCALVAVALVPPAPPRWSGPVARRVYPSRALEPRVQRAYALSRTLALRDSVLRATARSWQPGERLRVVAGNALPAALRAAIATTLAPARELIGGSGDGVRVLVAAVEDTLPPAPDLPVSPPGGIALAYVLPQATDGRTCLVIATLGPDAISTLHAAVAVNSLSWRDLWSRWTRASSSGALLGPCAFYGAFGPPGRRIAAWLQSTDDRPALDAAYFLGASGAAPEPVATPAWRRPWSWSPYLRPGLEACASGQAERCRDAVLAPSEPWSWWYAARFRVNAALSAPGVPNLGRLDAAGFQRLEGTETEFLGDVLRDVGPRRFAALWRSDEPLERAFARVVGEPLGTWTMHWVQRRLGRAPRGPTVPLAAALWALAVVGLAVTAGTAYAASRFRRPS